MLARKGIFTTPSIMQSHVSVIRALARVACITNHLHIFFQDRLAVEESKKNNLIRKAQAFRFLIVYFYYTIYCEKNQYLLIG